MTENEEKELREILSDDVVISVNELSNQKDRTLVYGYTCNRDTFHVYIKNKLLYLVCYDYYEKILNKIEGTELKAILCVPNKRVYPETCDYEFCKLLIKKGVDIPFTVRDKTQSQQQFYGLLL